MRLVTWNINSIRLRLDNVRRLIAEWAPEVLCLQETKTQDGLFPREAFEDLGYRHMLVHGMKGYNGVAILSRLPFDSATTRSWCARTDCRHAVVGGVPYDSRGKQTPRSGYRGSIADLSCRDEAVSKFIVSRGLLCSACTVHPAN